MTTGQQGGEKEAESVLMRSSREADDLLRDLGPDEQGYNHQEDISTAKSQSLPVDKKNLERSATASSVGSSPLLNAVESELMAEELGSSLPQAVCEDSAPASPFHSYMNHVESELEDLVTPGIANGDVKAGVDVESQMPGVPTPPRGSLPPIEKIGKAFLLEASSAAMPRPAVPSMGNVSSSVAPLADGELGSPTINTPRSPTSQLSDLPDSPDHWGKVRLKNFWYRKFHKDLQEKKKEPVTSPMHKMREFKAVAPLSSPQLYMMDEWLTRQGVLFRGEPVTTDNLEIMDAVDSKYVDAAKEEYLLRGERMMLMELLKEARINWRQACCNSEEQAALEAHYYKLEGALQNAKMAQNRARRKRMAYKHWVCCIPGYSCLDFDSQTHKILCAVRSNAGWQWLMLVVNIVNVLGLMLKETDEAAVEASVLQSTVIPFCDMLANIMFTIDMIVGMLVLGLHQYFSQAFNCLDFFIVVTGWIDVAKLGIVDFSSFRVLRILRPLRLLRYFKSIQAIVGALVLGWELIFNVMSFMFFFLLVFGILGVENFQGTLTRRCVVRGPAPAGWINMGKESPYLAPNHYNATYTHMFDAGATATMGEIEIFCNPDRDSLGFHCPSNMECIDVENPHNGYVGFDNFIQAFILQFQVQTLSTWYVYGYYSADSSNLGWITQFYYMAIIMFVGFVVAQLFISVVCFGFDSLAEKLEQPVFSTTVVGDPEDVDNLEDDMEALCDACSTPSHPLDGVEYDVDVGSPTGIRVNVSFVVQEYAPYPLGPLGIWPPSEAKYIDVHDTAQQPNGVGVLKSGSALESSSRVEGCKALEGSTCGGETANGFILQNEAGETQDGTGETQDGTGPSQNGTGHNETESLPSNPSANGDGDDPTERLKELQQLKDQGLIPEGEFVSEHPRILNNFAREESTKSTKSDDSEGIKANKVTSPTSPNREKRDERTPFNRYQDYVQEVKQAVEENEIAAANAPFRLADEVEDVPSEEIELAYEDLKVWSNHRIAVLKQMLFEQEDVDLERRVTFFRDTPGQTRMEITTTTMVKDLLQWPIVDGDGDPDPITIPSIRVQCRFAIMVEVQFLSRENSMVFHLGGTESIGTVIEMIQERSRPDHNLDNADLALYMNEMLLPQEWSLWYACETCMEEFSSMRSSVVITVTIDKQERFVNGKIFDSFIMAAIGGNTIFLAMEHHNQSQGFIDAQEVAEWVFNAIFIIEMLLKIWCLKGFKSYIQPLATKFDFLIVMSSICQIVLGALVGGADQLSVIKLFRIFRALRVVRVLRKVKSVRDILDAALGSIQPILNIIVFMMVLIIVFGCLGMQLYGGHFEFNDGEDKPREHFDDFPQAFYTLFQVLTGSGWESVLYNCMLSPENGGVWGYLFITSFFLFSNYIVLNLFIGAILSNMNQQTDHDRLEETHKIRQDRIAAQLRARSAQIWANSKYTLWAKGGCRGNLASLEEVMTLPFAKKTFEEAQTPPKRFGCPVNNRSFWYFDPENAIRRTVYNLVRHPYFDQGILMVIIISTVLLALDNPKRREHDGWVQFFTICDDVFLVIFSIEFVLKGFAFGFIWVDNIEFMLADQDTLKELVLGNTGEPAYMYNTWNYLDLVVLTVGYLNKFGDPDGPLKVLRLLRALRPLRMVNRIAGMRLILAALTSACPVLANVCALLIAVFLIFAILGLSLFMGRFFTCNDVEVAGQIACVGNIEMEGYMVPRVWKNPGLDGFGECSFDNIGSAFLVCL